MSFSKLGLSDQLVQGILATGYTAPTTIQSSAIPIAVSGRDIIGIAQTGTGKTAAFVLPMLNHFLKHANHKVHRTRGLVLTPTRELAQQVEEFVAGYGRFTNFHSLAIFGGVSMENQIKRLRRGIDIVVATPGRLIDHINRKTIDLSHIEILVLDEADRMFDMGFINDVKRIISRIPVKRQTLLFSATMSKEVKSLVADIQHDPELIEIGEQRKPVETVKQFFYSAPQENKIELLLHLLKTRDLDSVLVFSRTKHGADKISHRLERNGIKAVAIHSNRTQAQRQRAMAGFKQGQYKVMVATDIAARGIDVEGISHVVNYDTPTFAEDYIHRIGRTGRASSTGEAITFVSNQEHKYLKSIERFVGRHFDLKMYSGFDYAKKLQPSEKHTGSKSSGDGHSERHEKSDRHRDHRRNEFQGKPDNNQRHSESSESGYNKQRQKENSRKSHNGPRHGVSSDRSFRGKRGAENWGKSRGGSGPQYRRDNDGNRHIAREQNNSYSRQQSVERPVNPEPENDWRSLVAKMDEGRGSFRKKLKRLFIREKV